MSDNTKMDLWKRVCETDPKHVKPITGKQYKGNSPKPYYIVQRLTEEFGPCGTGWGLDIQKEYMHLMPDNETTLHVAIIDFWYKRPDGEHGSIQQVGQTKASYKTNSGSWMIDEDAPKKSVTDALVKCASYLGFAGDIFMGMWDDSKYVEEINSKFREEEQREAEKEMALSRASAEERLRKKDELIADWKAKFDECATRQDVAKTWTNFKAKCDPDDGDVISAVGTYKQGIAAAIMQKEKNGQSISE